MDPKTGEILAQASAYIGVFHAEWKCAMLLFFVPFFVTRKNFFITNFCNLGWALCHVLGGIFLSQTVS